MFGSTILDVGIGLALTYLSLSLVVTAANELLATAVRSRARDLERGVRNLIDGRSSLPERWWEELWRWLKSWTGGKSKKPVPGGWSEAFFKHQLVNALSQDDQRPCYIPAQTFSTVLMHLVQRSAQDPSTWLERENEVKRLEVEAAAAKIAAANAQNAAVDAAADAKPEKKQSLEKLSKSLLIAAADAQINVDAVRDILARREPPSAPPMSGLVNFEEIQKAIAKIDNEAVKNALLPLVEEARTDLTDGIAAMKKFSDQVETWFDHAMDRVSGWYVRRTKWYLFAIAALFTIVLNVDSVAICRRLSNDATLRDSIVEAAKQYTATTTAPPKSEGQAAAAGKMPPDLGASLRHVQAEVGRLNGLGLPLGWRYGGVTVKQAAADDADADLSRYQKAAEVARTAAKDKDEQSPEVARFRMAKAQLADAEESALQAHKDLDDARRIASSHAPPRDDDLNAFLSGTGGFGFALTKLAGLLLTAFAASLGAPFWFDVLNRFMSVRGAGKAPEEKPKNPKQVLQPQSPKETP